MTPSEFIKKWKAANLKERSGSQEHFTDLCRLLDEPTPAEADPSGLDPDKRSQLGAHYTDRDKIMMLVEPVIIRPLQTEWEVVKAQIAQQMERAEKAKAAFTRTRAWNAAQALHNRFLDQLKEVRVLDPACGSGNFLYLAILALKDLEHKANLDAEVLD